MNTRSRINPFQVGTEIRNRADFVGRKDILKTISSKMVALQSVSLHGERRTGKTSLLLYLAHPDTVSAMGLPPTHIPVYFNFQGFATAGTADVWQAIAEAIASQIEQRARDGQVQSKRFLATTSESSQFANNLGNALAGLGRANLRVHLLFDEFEQTAENPHLGNDFYQELRSVPERARNFSYLIATRTGLADLQLKTGDYTEISSPFFNIFTTLTLEPFWEDEVNQLILHYFDRSGVDFSLAEKLLAQLPFLYEMTGYHPFFLQTLCYHLFERLDYPDWPMGQARQEALRDFERDSEPHFRFYWDVSSEQERTLIGNLVTGQVPDRDVVGNAVQRLEDRCLIVRADSGWRLFSSVFDRWVQERIRRLQELEDLYTAGRTCFVKGQWEAAIGSWQRIVDSGETYKDTTALIEEASRQLRLQALYAEADIQLQEMKWVEATQTLEEILSIDPIYKDVKARLDHAREQNRLRILYEEALSHFRGQRWSRAITILELLGVYRDSASKLKEAQKQQDLATLYMDAVGAQETGQWTRAIDKFQEIVRKTGVHKDVARRLDQVQGQLQQELVVRFNRGERYRRQRRWKEAAAEFERVYALALCANMSETTLLWKLV